MPDARVPAQAAVQWQWVLAVSLRTPQQRARIGRAGTVIFRHAERAQAAALASPTCSRRPRPLPPRAAALATKALLAGATGRRA
jgi:hypothetical protein